ncbi:unnamed protein product [Penicillium roqueforti FM164]|uniref:Genomic scaffold, ProqFM164S01 n=1 Tax=Penicillium roqueforti (strain FM164) TaxID=1365484 RepID=W6Q049_PENRF|nr:unnamed protein product [Penicillium roqueforti FM164]
MRYCEALILLLYQYIDGTDILDKNKLQEGYRKFYHTLKQGDPEIYSILDKLRLSLIEERRLPIIND